MNDKIKRCPFCGGQADLYSDLGDPYDGRRIVFIKCELCGARGKAFPVADDPCETGDWDTVRCHDAVEAWNLRRADSEYESLLKRVLEVVADLKTLCHPEEETKDEG